MDLDKAGGFILGLGGPVLLGDFGRIFEVVDEDVAGRPVVPGQFLAVAAAAGIHINADIAGDFQVGGNMLVIEQPGIKVDLAIEVDLLEVGILNDVAQRSVPVGIFQVDRYVLLILQIKINR